MPKAPKSGGSSKMSIEIPIEKEIVIFARYYNKKGSLIPSHSMLGTNFTLNLNLSRSNY